MPHSVSYEPKYEPTWKIKIKPPCQTTSSGLPFWSGPKRCPHPLNFDSSNPLHFEYVFSAANIKASMYGIPPETDKQKIHELLKETRVKEFQPIDGVKINLSEKEEDNSQDTDIDEEMLNQYQREILDLDRKEIKALVPVEFEKDDDSNFHMDFITACSNLRAENYDIAPSDKHNSKLIAGKIIPAIATTTSVIVGLDCIELYKIVQGHKDLSKYRNTYINLALPFFSSSEPMEVPKNKYNEVEWSLWDSFEVKGDMTLRQFLDHFKEEHNLKVSMVVKEYVTLYSEFLPKATTAERMEMKMTEILEKIKKEKLTNNIKKLVFSISCYDMNDEDVDVPMVNYFI